MVRHHQNTVLIASLVGLSSLVSQAAVAEEQNETLNVSENYFNASSQPVSTIEHFDSVTYEQNLREAIAQNYDDIWGVVGTQPQFSILQAAIASIALSDTLRSDTDYTLLAPTDAAFDRLPQGTVDVLLQPENRDLLAEVLKYHLIPGEVTASEMTTGTVDTLNGGIAVRVTENNDIIVNNGSIVNANITASNGVIHSINQVLMPQSLRDRVLTVVQQDQSS